MPRHGTGRNTGPFCHLAPRWDVVLTQENGIQEAVIAEYRNRGANRDAYVLDEKRIMKLAPITHHEDQNDREVVLHKRIALLSDTKVLPDVLGIGRTSVAGHTFSWLILERASWTMSDMMLHPEVCALPIRNTRNVALRCACSCTVLPSRFPPFVRLG